MGKFTGVTQLTQEQFDRCMEISGEIWDRLDHRRQKNLEIAISASQCIIEGKQYVQLMIEHHKKWQGEKKWDLFTIPAIDVHNNDWLKHVTPKIKLPPLPDGYDSNDCNCADCLASKQRRFQYFSGYMLELGVSEVKAMPKKVSNCDIEEMIERIKLHNENLLLLEVRTSEE